MEVMRSLEGAGDWEKLAAWMIAVWSLLPESWIVTEYESAEYESVVSEWAVESRSVESKSVESKLVDSVEQVTFKLLLHLPSALPRFEGLCEEGTLNDPFHLEYRDKLRGICDQARAKADQSSTDSLPPP